MAKRELSLTRTPSVPIIGAGEIPRIQFSSGAAQALQSFSRDMFSLSNGFQDQLDQQAEAEGTVAGAIAGSAGEPELQDYGTIRGRAFNKAAVDSFVTGMETQSIYAVQDIATRYANDPVGMEKALNAYGTGVTETVGKVYAPAAAAMKQRLAVRAIQPVEAAKDRKVAMTRSQADAALIEGEVALAAEMKELSGDLFSENPVRSSAAAEAIGVLQSQYLARYEAVDTVTGRPLYSPEEKAKAKVKFYGDAMESAAGRWFEQQPDKAKAYLKFTEEGFGFEIKTAGGTPAFKGDAAAFLKTRLQSQHGPEHIDGMSPVMRDRLASLISSAPDEVKAGLQILSGKRSNARQRQLWNASDKTGRMVARPGRSRHEHGDAADLGWNGGKLSAAPENVKKWVHDNAKTFGLRFPMSYEPWHIETVEARGGKVPPPTTQTIDVRKAFPPAAFERATAEMRANLSFSNSLADREAVRADKAMKAEQELAEFDYTQRLWARGNDPETGQPVVPLSRPEILTAVRQGRIGGAKGESLIKAMETEKPAKSDPMVVRDLQRRLYAGEDVYSLIVDQGDKLSVEDSGQLMRSNNEQNVLGEGRMSKEAQFFETQLKDLLTPDGYLAKLDSNAEERKFLALTEYRRRVQDPERTETEEEISDDIRRRASLANVEAAGTAMSAMVRPRFSIMDPAKAGRIDVKASRAALIAARKDGRLSDKEVKRQTRALKEWEDAQTAADRAAAAAETKKKGK